MSPNRSERLQLSHSGAHAEVVSDHLIAPILQGTREAIGAALEGKNRLLEKILNKCMPNKPLADKKTWLGKGWRILNRDIFRRAIILANNIVDTVGTAAISTVDVVNNIQGEIHDVFTHKDTSKGIGSFVHGLSDVVRRRGIKESLRNGLIKNKTSSTDFSGTSQRNYGKTTTPPRRPAPATP